MGYGDCLTALRCSTAPGSPPRQAPREGEACGPSPASPVGAVLPRQKGPLHRVEQELWCAQL